jgi:hypothetical protein
MQVMALCPTIGRQPTILITAGRSPILGRCVSKKP